MITVINHHRTALNFRLSYTGAKVETLARGSNQLTPEGLAALKKQGVFQSLLVAGTIEVIEPPPPPPKKKKAKKEEKEKVDF